MFDVIIVGAGVMGSATAFQLSELGKKCLLIDRFPLGHVHGSSHGDSRIIRRSYPEKHFAELMKDAYTLWNSLEDRYKKQFIVTTGGLDFGIENSFEMKKVVETVENFNIQHSILSNQEIMSKFPVFNLDDEFFGIYQPDAGIIRASQVLHFFQESAQKNGLEVLTGEKVSLIKEEQDHLLVSTKSKTFKTKKLIICAGSWINEFFKNYRIEHRTKVLPVNYGYWKVQEPTQFKAGKMPVFISWGEKTFYGFGILERENYFKVGAHYSYTEKPFRTDDVSKIINPNIVDDLVNFVGNTFPGAEQNIYEIDSCFYTMNDKENFIMDFHPDNSNIIFGGGFSGHGFKFAPLIGKILADLVLNSFSDYNISPFRFSNFKK